MNTITALSAINAIGSATSDSGNRQQHQQQPAPGQILTATVLKSTDSNRFYLDIAGKKFLAQSDTVTLTAGAKLQLEVLNTKPVLELRIASKETDMFFGKTLTLLGRNLDISSLLQSLQNSQPPLFGLLSTTSQNTLIFFLPLQQNQLNSPDGGIDLKQLLDKLGLSFEAIIAGGNKEQKAGESLKAALLEIAALVKGNTELTETTNKLLGTLELYQMAQLRLANENLFIFPLPLSFLNHGYLLVENEDEQKKEGEEETSVQRFSLHLNLDPLGNIEITFLHTTEGIYIRFACDSKDKTQFTSTFQDDLKQMISSIQVLGLSFTEGAGNPAQELIQHLIPDGKNMLDTKV